MKKSASSPLCALLLVVVAAELMTSGSAIATSDTLRVLRKTSECAQITFPDLISDVCSDCTHIQIVASLQSATEVAVGTTSTSTQLTVTNAPGGRQIKGEAVSRLLPRVGIAASQMTDTTLTVCATGVGKNIDNYSISAFATLHRFPDPIALGFFGPPALVPKTTLQTTITTTGVHSSAVAFQKWISFDTTHATAVDSTCTWLELSASEGGGIEGSMCLVMCEKIPTCTMVVANVTACAVCEFPTSTAVSGGTPLFTVTASSPTITVGSMSVFLKGKFMEVLPIEDPVVFMNEEPFLESPLLMLASQTIAFGLTFTVATGIAFAACWSNVWQWKDRSPGQT